MLNKITEEQYAGKRVADADHRLSGSADENQEIFDRLTMECVVPAFNALVDALTAESGAAEIGAKLDSIPGSNVQEILAGLKKAMDDLVLESGSGIQKIYMPNGAEDGEGGVSVSVTAEKVGATPTTYYKTITTGAEWEEGETESIQGIDVTGLTVTANTRMDVMTSTALLTAMQENGVSAVLVETRAGGAQLVCIGGILPEGVTIELNIVEVKSI